MYIIERKQKLQEGLTLKDGDKELVVYVDINLDDALRRYWQYYEKLVQCKDKLAAKATPETEKDVGDAFLDLFRFLFGEKQAEDIIRFYDENYSELLEDVCPFLFNVVFPAFQEAKYRRIKALSKSRMKK